MSFVLVRYLHFISVIALFALLLFEFYLLKPSLKGRAVKYIANVDLSYWAVGIVVLVTGILLTVAVGKGMNFYIHNPVYDLKVGLFLGAVAATLYPTWFLQSRRRIPDDDDDDVQVPRTILYIIRAKLAVLTTLPLFAVMMAQGIGLG